MTALIDGRPTKLHAMFRPGNTFTATFTWASAGSLTGRTFTATLDADTLTASIAGDVLTVSATDAQTTTAGVGSHDFALTETTGGTSDVLFVGTWEGTTTGAASQGTAVTITESASSVTVEVPAVSGGHAALELGAGAHGTEWPEPRSDATTGWEETVFSTEDAVSAATTLTFEHGQVVIRGSGAGTGVRSNRRSVFLIPGSPGGYSRLRSRWGGPSYAAGAVPQRGHMHGFGTQADGMIRGVIIWHDIVFSAPWVFNIGIWETDPSNLVTGFTPTSMAVAGTGTITAGARSSNVVTLTVGSGHGFKAGDVVTVDVADGTYDGTFALSAVSDTTVSYQQTAADDASSGAGTMVLARQTLTKSGLLTQYASSAGIRASGVVTATVATGHPFQVGDHIGADFDDATYDGNFAVTAVTSTTVKWGQAAADDASAGTGTLTKVLPYWVESEWTDGVARFRVWPDVTATPNGSVGPGGPPGWESPWASSVDLSSLGTDEPDPSLGEGCGLLGAHLASGSTVTELRYDSIEAWGR